MYIVKTLAGKVFEFSLLLSRGDQISWLLRLSAGIPLVKALQQRCRCKHFLCLHECQAVVVHTRCVYRLLRKEASTSQELGFHIETRVKLNVYT